jgi:acyl-CoA thioesterase
VTKMRSMPTPYSTLLASSTTLGDELDLAIPDDWMQGRSVFGGLQAALAVRAMRGHVDAALPLRTLQVTFVAPVAGTLRARATVLRRGGSATHVEARVSGTDGVLAAIVIGVFGVARRSAIAVMPVREDVEAVKPAQLAYTPGVVPAFIQHFTARWLRGALPFSGAKETSHVIELGMHDEGAASEAHVIAIADFTPPLALTFLKAPANGSTVTWMLELLADGFERFGLTGWRIDAELAAARDGYTNQALTVWAPDGTPIAFGRQSMLVFG